MLNRSSRRMDIATARRGRRIAGRIYCRRNRIGIGRVRGCAGAAERHTRKPESRSADRGWPEVAADGFEVASSRERMMKPLHRDAFGREHLVGSASRIHGLIWKLIEDRVPARIADKQRRLVGEVRLDAAAVRTWSSAYRSAARPRSMPCGLRRLAHSAQTPR